MTSSIDLLVLGGTAFLGRAVAQEALVRGHRVTCAARGTSPPPEGATFVTLDRDEVDGLRPVADHNWDAVIDVSRQPGQVRRAVRELRTQHWVFVSSGNVYADFSRLEQPESGALLPPLGSEVMDDMSTYGEAKVACEDAVRTSGATATIVRSGLIAGPGDWSGRSGYYPWRFANPTGSDVLVPDDLEFPCAMIDVRDLAAWLVSSARERFDGTYNATGPTSPLKQVLSAAALAAESNTKLLPVPVATLSELGVSAWMGPKSLPSWIDDPDWRYFATLDTSAARSAGLQTRPLLETLRDTLVFENQRTEPRQTGLTDDEERSLRSQLGK